MSDSLRILLVDEITGHPVGDGFYQSTLGRDDAKAIVNAVLDCQELMAVQELIFHIIEQSKQYGQSFHWYRQIVDGLPVAVIAWATEEPS